MRSGGFQLVTREDDLDPGSRSADYPIPMSAQMSTPGGSGPSLGRVVKRALAGRLRWAILLATIGLLGGGGLGWTLPNDEYRSVGTIFIDPSLPTLEDPRGQNTPPRFEAFIDEQVALMTSDRVAALAVESRAWRALGRGGSQTEVDDFKSSLGISRAKRTQRVVITFLDPDPGAAQVGVQVAIAAYQTVAKDFNNREINDTLDRLQYERNLSSIELGNLERDIAATAREHGGEQALLGLHIAYMSRVTDLEFRYRELEDRIALMREDEERRDGSGPGGSGSVPDRTDEREAPGFSAQEIYDRGDAAMVQLFRLKRQLADQVKYYVEVRGLGPSNAEMIAAKMRELALDREIEERVRVYNETRAGGPGGMSREKMEAEAIIVKRSLESARTQAGELSRAYAELEGFMTRKTALNKRLDELRQIERELNDDKERRGKIRVLSDGSRPNAPYRDNRVKSAAMGGFLGGGLGFLIVLMIGLLDRRIKSSEDATGGLPQIRLLGLLPDLPDKPDQTAEVEMVAHSVHQMRTFLEIGATSDDGLAYCLTGPSPGTGKSTMTLALGLSFANSGARTLILDCDFTGRGLWRQVRAMLIGKVQRFLSRTHDRESEDGVPEGEPLPDSEGLVHLLCSARDLLAHRPEPEVDDLVRLLTDEPGALTTSDNGIADSVDLLLGGFLAAREGDQETKNRVIALRGVSGLTVPLSEAGRTIPDMIDAITGAAIEQCARPTGVPNLWCVPGGRASSDFSGKVSFAALSRLIEDAKAHFDTVLIDTGPIPGSLEANIGAALSDAVVLVISRGEQRQAAERAVLELDALGANFAGFVFNRASSLDVLSRSQSYPGSRRAQHDE